MASSLLYRRAIPAAARITRWTASDGWSFRRFDWPADGTPRGSILFEGGRGDIFEKYLELFAHWHSQGWAVTWLDWRGQAGSGRLTANAQVGDIDSFSTYIADFKEFYDVWSAQAAGRKILMGHSMGGHLVLRAAVEGVVRADALVLVAPMLGLRNAFGAALGERIARLIGGIGNASRQAWKGNEKPGGLDTRQALLTHDPDRYADEIWWQEAKPDIVTGPPSWRWVIEAFASTRQLRADSRLKLMRIPTLMLVPMADQLVDARAAVAVGAKLPDCRVLRFGKEAAHEVLREVDSVRNRAIGEIDIFLASRAQQE
ncbi:alpha/beta fold hydrolase [Sphingomonas sp. 28-63-12]|uniref:alpha/beta fold hydrolase n=1 Tax=Sphingomonas sp. 28-63-12 TaxID=1970434 RepID=UPI000BD3EF1A|nr:MAG: lysophospholipase [Sphingomonas sp. 28-63-12]